MKKILLACSVAALLFADTTVNIEANTWRMTGFGYDANLSLEPSIPESAIVWFWNNGTWGAFSKDAALKDLLVQHGYYAEYVPKDAGVWILSRENYSFIPYTPSYVGSENRQGWNLKVTYNTKFTTDLQDGEIGIFTYRNGSWQYKVNLNGNVTGNLENIDAGEGYWVYYADVAYSGDNVVTVDHKSFVILSNHTLTLSNGLSLTFNSDGTVSSNQEAFDGMEWSVKSVDYGWDEIFLIVCTNGAKRLTLVGNFDYASQSMNIFKIVTMDQEQLPDGRVVFSNIESEAVMVDSFESVPVEIAINSAIREVWSTVQGILENGAVEASSQLATARTILESYANDPHAKFVLAALDIVEILTSDVVQSAFEINGHPLSLDTFFQYSNFASADPFGMIELAQNLSGYSDKIQILAKDLATQLHTASQHLKEAANDPEFIISEMAQYMEDEVAFDAADVKLMATIADLVSFYFQYIGSYSWGSDDWLAIRNEIINGEEVEYQEAFIDPVGYINARAPLSNPDLASLQVAKGYLIDALESYLAYIDGAERGLEFTSAQSVERNSLKYAHDILQNLKGLYDHIVIVDGDQKVYLNFAALFDTPITSNDFPTFRYDEDNYDPTLSKLAYEPVNSYNQSIGMQPAQLPTAPNNINKFILRIEDYDNVYEGTALLQKLFAQ